MSPPIIRASVALGLFLVFHDCQARSADLFVPQQYKSIQSAIDAAKANDVVLVSAGTYRETIELKPNVEVRSAGNNEQGKLGFKRAEATIIDAQHTKDAPGVLMAADSTLDGFTVTNVGQYDDEKWKKHHAPQGNDQAHEHIGAPGHAGISIVGVNCTVKNNIVHHIGYSGIGIEGVKGKGCEPVISRNVCYRNMGGGIGSMKGSKAIIDSNVCFQNFYAGIGHDNASPTVTNNTCYENIRAGIGISEGACPLVRNNKCYKNRRAGIGSRTDAATRPLIENNDCYENDMAGIGAEEHAAPIIRGNRCFRNKLTGIGSRLGAHPTIIGNECYENEKAGIGQMSDAVTVLIDNYIHHNKTAGIGFEKSTKGRSTVINNRVIDNKLVAVGIHSGWTVNLSDNELSRKDGLPPIVMVFQGADATFTNNTIRGGGVAGIRVAGNVRAEGNSFLGEKIRPVGPPNFAVWALPGSKVVLRKNIFKTWRHAIVASKSTVSATGNEIRDFHKSPMLLQDSSVNVSGNQISESSPQNEVKKR